MSDPIISYVPKESLLPGQMAEHRRTDGVDYIAIANYVWPCFQRNLKEHELWHAKDPVDEHWVIDEWQANLYAAKKEPLGMLANILHFIITPARWNYYKNRKKDKK